MNFDYSSLHPNHLPCFMSTPSFTMPVPYQQENEKEALQLFWHKKWSEIQNTGDFKSQPHLPLARIKRMMKAKGDVKAVSAEAPILIAKACEIFIEELTLRAWLNTQQNDRQTIRRHDIARAIEEDDTHTFHFLAGSVPMEHQPHCSFKDMVAINKEQVAQPHMMMQMDRDQQVAPWDHQFPEAYYMMQRPFMPPHQIPYRRFHPY